MGTDGSFSGSKVAEAWSWPHTPTSAEVKKKRIYTSTPPHALMA
jgi:deoxyhypusine synthase